MKVKNMWALVCAGAVVCSTLSGCAEKSDKSPQSDTGDSKEKLVVAMELAYPPFETKDTDGNPTGVSADFCKAFGEAIGREVVIENTAWDGLIPSLQTGKADMVMSSMTITEERKESVDFSDPYANALLAILTGKDSGVSSIDDLNVSGRKIACKTGSTGYIYAEKFLPEAQLVGLPDESACITEVVQGKADAFLYDQLTIYRNWKNNEDKTKAVFIPFQDAENWGIAVKKGNTELLDQLNDFIRQYRADGGFDALSEKYLSEQKTAFETLGFEWFFDIEE